MTASEELEMIRLRDELARCRADAVANMAMLRCENEYLRIGLRSIVEDDTYIGSEIRDIAKAILDRTFAKYG